MDYNNKETEYNYKKIIGNTFETFSTKREKYILDYYHKQESNTVYDLIKKMHLKNFDDVVDLGCSIGVWYDNFKNWSFKKIIGIDISEERALQAKNRGFDETHITNAYDLPFENNSKSCIISNHVFIHVLQDSDKLKILNEVRRVLKNDGIFIFNFQNALGHGYDTDTTRQYERYNTIKTISNLINKSQLKLEIVSPGYYAFPNIGANPKLAKFSCKFIFPLFDSIFETFKNLKMAKSVYFGVRKV